MYQRCFFFLFIFFNFPITALAQPDNRGGDLRNCTAQAINIETQRPILYVTNQKLSHIRENLTKEPLKRIWTSLLNDAENDLKKVPDLKVSWKKMNLPDLIPRLAFVYLLTNDKRFLDHAILWIDAYVQFKNWGKNEDLVAGHALFALSVAYDWLYSELGIERRNNVKHKILDHASTFYYLLDNNKIWWANTLLQNHNYYNVMALAISGVSLYNDCTEAKQWLDASEINFANVAGVLSPDGASHEGVGYWSAGTEALLSYIYGVRTISTKDDSLIESSFLKNTAKYRLYMSLPGYRENANYADSKIFEWTGPGNVLRALASIYRDPRPQWLADEVERARSIGPKTWLDKPKYSWLDLLWYDGSVGRAAPQDLPNYTYFSNLGLYVHRTDWTNNAAWLLYKAAPPQGWHAYRKGLIARGHIHPDEGQVLYYGGGKWLLRDDSYVTPKWTKNHNVIIVNNKGQLGEGHRWFQGGVELNRKASVSLVHKQFDNNSQYIVTDNTIMYPKGAGLKRWLRSVVTLAGGNVLIVDDIDVGGKGDVSTLFHLDHSAYAVDNDFVCLDGDDNRFTLKQLYPAIYEYKLDIYTIDQNDQHGMDLGFYSGKLLEIKDKLLSSTRKVYQLMDQPCNVKMASNFNWVVKGKTLDLQTNAGRYDINLDNYNIHYADVIKSQNNE